MGGIGRCHPSLGDRLQSLCSVEDTQSFGVGWQVVDASVNAATAVSLCVFLKSDARLFAVLCVLSCNLRATSLCQPWLISSGCQILTDISR